MTLTVHEQDGRQWIEGPAGQPLLRQPGDVNTLIEASFEHGTTRLLLYSENLTERFFDLSSGDAGEILQKLRNYHIRLAVVHSPTVQLSRRFEELMIEENQMPHFRLFEDRQAAQAWLDPVPADY